MDFARQGLAVLFVLALLWFALRFVKGRGTPLALARVRSGQSRRVETLGRVVLGPQHSIHVVRIGGREMVLGVHPAGITVISQEGGEMNQQEIGAAGTS